MDFINIHINTFMNKNLNNKYNLYFPLRLRQETKLRKLVNVNKIKMFKNYLKSNTLIESKINVAIKGILKNRFLISSHKIDIRICDVTISKVN